MLQVESFMNQLLCKQGKGHISLPLTNGKRDLCYSPRDMNHDQQSKRVRKKCRGYEAASGVMLTGFHFELYNLLEYGLVQIVQLFCITFSSLKQDKVSNYVMELRSVFFLSSEMHMQHSEQCQAHGNSSRKLQYMEKIISKAKV